MITKSVNAGCRSETTVNTFSDHDSSPGRLELPGQPLAATHTAVPTVLTQRHTTTQKYSPTVALARATPMTREDLNLAAWVRRPEQQPSTDLHKHGSAPTPHSQYGFNLCRQFLT
jgi:hypothetical protein